MARKHSSEEIAAILGEYADGVPSYELLRRVGVTRQTFARWMHRYVGPAGDQAREIVALRAENLQLKRQVAELTLIKLTLQDALRDESPDALWAEK